jgi:hypothetical protein
MKKLFALVALVYLCGTTHAQSGQTDPTGVKRVVVWDIPRTDSFLLSKDTRPVLAFTASNTPIYILANQELYDMIVAQFYDSATQVETPKGYYVGFEFAVDYVEGFSLYSNKQLKNLVMSLQQRAVFQAFNTKAKYTVLAQSPYIVYGQKVRNPITKEIYIKQVLKEEVAGNPGAMPIQNTGNDKKLIPKSESDKKAVKQKDGANRKDGSNGLMFRKDE